MNKTAQKLGRMAKGKRKTLSKAERKRRAERLAIARQKRWPSTQNAGAVHRRGSDVGTSPLLAVSGGDE